jgi:hypothetical protein
MDRYGIPKGDIPRQTVELERLGQSYRVSINPLGAAMLFRDVRVDRDLSADISVSLRDRHILRTGSVSLGMRSRSEVARTAHELSGVSDLPTWKQGVFAAAELVMEAEEQLPGAADLRRADLTTNGALYALRPLAYSGPTTLTMPGKAGKSTVDRAMAVSIALNRTVIPGTVPLVHGPVLYVAAEAPVIASHARSIEAICRGLGIDRRSVEHEIRLQPTFGRPLHRIARSLAERAADFALVILDSYQALQSMGDNGQGIRERDSLFWNSIDQFDRPVHIVAHPNREDALRWDRVREGRPAGSEVARDRIRMGWMGKTKELKAVVGERYRRYTLSNSWFNDGATLPDISFAMHWTLGLGDEDPGTVRFIDLAEVPASVTEPDQPEADKEVQATEISDAMRETLDAWRAGARTPGALRDRIPSLSVDGAKARLRRLRESGLVDADQGGEQQSWRS